MKKFLGFFVITTLIVPALTRAQGPDACSSDGYTVVFVNGVFNDEAGATANVSDLESWYEGIGSKEDVRIRLAHNPTHINIAGVGIGDLGQAVTQALSKPIAAADRYHVIRQIHEQLETRKVLLVGHSQGTYYTNEVYDYLSEHGIPPQSIDIYNVASVAGRLADNPEPGEGDYLTSENDAIVNLVRDITGTVGTEDAGDVSPYHAGVYGAAGSHLEAIQVPLPANIELISNDPGTHGHAFSDDYLAGASARIIQEIDAKLSDLVADAGDRGGNGCFTSPDVEALETLENLIVSGLLDSFAGGLTNMASFFGEAVTSFAQNLENMFAWLWQNDDDQATKEEKPNEEENQSVFDQNLSADLFALLEPPLENPPPPPPNEDESAQAGGAALEEEIHFEEPREELTGDEPEGSAGQPGEIAGIDTFTTSPNPGEGFGGSEEDADVGETENEDSEPAVEEEPDGVTEEGDEEEEPELISGTGPIGGWGIKTSGAGRPPLLNPDIGPTIFDATQAEDDFGDDSLHVNAATLVGGDTYLSVWIEWEHVFDDEGIQRTDARLRARRVDASGGWLDEEPLLLADPSVGTRITRVVGVQRGGEFHIFYSWHDDIWDWNGGDPDPGTPHGVDVVTVSAGGEVGEAEELLAPSYYFYSSKAPDVRDAEQVDGGILLIWKDAETLYATLIGDDGTLRSDTILGTRGRLRASRVEATCEGTECMVAWSTVYGIRLTRFDTATDDWTMGSCPNFAHPCIGVLLIDTTPALLATGFAPVDTPETVYVLWTNGTEELVAGFVDRDEFFSGNLNSVDDIGDVVTIAEYDEEIGDSGAIMLPDGSLLVFSLTDAGELTATTWEIGAESATLSLVPDVAVVSSAFPACTEETCAILFRGALDGVEGIHLLLNEALLTEEL